MLLAPRTLVAAAAVLAIFFFGLKPWGPDSKTAAGWWIAPPSAWAGELRATIDKASRQSFFCREQFVNRTADGVKETSSTGNMLFVCGDRYRRDIFDHDHLRETQWYVLGPQELTVTCVRYGEKNYSVTHDPKAPQGEDANPLRRIEALPELLARSGGASAPRRSTGATPSNSKSRPRRSTPGTTRPRSMYGWIKPRSCR